MNLYDSVTLKNDIPELKAGAKGAIVDKFPDNHYAIEFFDSDGDTIDVLTVSGKDLVLRKRHVPTRLRERRGRVSSKPVAAFITTPNFKSKNK